MFRARCYLLLLLTATPGWTVYAQSVNELSAYLSLFSAHASSAHAVRVNWSLETQSPAHRFFRIYRGYEEVGNFAVLAEVNATGGDAAADYSFTDTSARTNVSYYYKISAVGQYTESIFPVVISATPTRANQPPTAELPPAAILTGREITLYVRKPGEVKLELVDGESRLLVNEFLRPGIYEFDGNRNRHARLKLTHNHDFYVEASWPMRVD